MRLTLMSFACLITACSEPNTNMVTEQTGAQLEIPPVWFDQGIQCMNETKDATFSLDALPDSVEQELVDYLDLEFGAPRYSQPLAIEDLSYVGLFSACEQNIKLWRFPCAETQGCFVAAQPWQTTYLITTVYPEFDLTKPLN